MSVLDVGQGTGRVPPIGSMGDGGTFMEPKISPVGAKCWHHSTMSSKAREGSRARLRGPGSRTFQGFTHVVPHPGCPVLTSTQTLTLTSKPSPIPNQGSLSSSEPSSHTTLGSGPHVRARGPQVSLLPNTFTFRTEEPWPKEELGSALRQASPFMKEQGNDGSQQA